MAKNPFPKARVKTVTVGGVRFGGGALALIAGPCVIESRTMALDLAARLAALARREKIPLVFKASYDKANRTSIGAFRGPGLAKGLEILAEIKAKHRVPILVDVHQVGEVAAAAEVADILQLPALIFSGFMFPIENMPLPLRVISHVVPTRWYYSIVRAIMIKGLGIASIWKETLILGGMTIVLIAIAVKKFKVHLQ